MSMNRHYLSSHARCDLVPPVRGRTVELSAARQEAPRADEGGIPATPSLPPASVASRHERSAAARVLLTLRTLRSLRWEQVVYRVVRRVQRLATRVPRDRPAPSWQGEKQLASLLDAGPGDAATRVASADRLMDHEFRFLGVAVQLPDVDWRSRYVSHLWTYHLHYFGWGLDLAWATRLSGKPGYGERAVAQMLAWVEGTEPGLGEGWEPYPVAVRLDNWMRILALLGDGVPDASRARLLSSVAAQADFLSRRLEYHLLGNHLLMDFSGLAMAGLYCEGEAAQRWRVLGLAGLRREVSEQVLPDGGHFERSPSYHALVLAAVLRVLAALKARGELAPDGTVARAEAMLKALDVLFRPDGTPHLFNDSTLDMAPGPSELRALAAAAGLPIPSPGAGVAALPATGYFSCVRPDDCRLVIDAGDLGPSFQPGHGHCDLLSFEFDDLGVPCVVDSGVHGYEGDPFREYSRSARAHNTIVIDSREQSEVWATFRVARRAKVLASHAAGTPRDFEFHGAYQPYHDENAVHRRTIRWNESLVVTDEVSGARGRTLASHVHVHPEWNVVVHGPNVVMSRRNRRLVLEPFGCDQMILKRGERSPVQGWYLPRFGSAIPAFCICLLVGANDGRRFGFTIHSGPFSTQHA